MGAFFTNFHIRGDSPERVAAVLKRRIRARAYVSEAKNGWVSAYDISCEEQNVDELQRLAKALSEELGAAVFAFLVHDSDVFYYWLYEHGALRDEYNSCPDYFSDDGVDDATWQRLAGNPQAIVSLAAPGATAEAIAKALQREKMDPASTLDDEARLQADPYIFAEQRLREFACLLGIDEYRASMGFHDVEQGRAAKRAEFLRVDRA